MKYMPIFYVYTFIRNFAAQYWLSSQTVSFCQEGIQKLIPCYDKYLNTGGNCLKSMAKGMDCHYIISLTLFTF